MNEKLCIEKHIYNCSLYNRLLAKKSEDLTPEEKSYVVYCYHHEEAQAGIL